MDTDIQAKIAQRLAELPADVRQAIQSAEWEHKLRDMGQKHALHIDQMGALEDETLLVMLGFAHADEFAANIANGLHVPQDVAQALALEINTAVFLPIRESMKGFMAAKAAPQNEPVTSVPAALTPPSIPAAPVGTPLQSPTPPVVPPIVKPIDVHTETILQTPTSSVAPAVPKVDPKPISKADPYREPVE